jgi:HlyD family secretion protein
MNPTDNRRPAWRQLFKWTLLACAVLALLFLTLRNQILGTPVETHEAQRSDLVQSVVASGRLITPQRVSVGTEVTGRVARIPVEEGQNVRKGQVLIELNDKDEQAAVTQAAAAVSQAEARLRQLREVGLPAAEQILKQAQANVTQARQQYDRNKELQARGFLGQAQLDDAQRNLDVAESQLRAAQLQVQTNRPTGSDYALAQSTLEQARANLLAARAKLDETVIHAPADGILIARSVEPGTVVQPGKELMVLAPAGETQIIVAVDERNLSQLALGQNALGSADAYPGQRFAAELIYINPGIDATRGSVEVKLRVPKPPAYLRQDMTVSVDIEVARRANTLVIPADAARDATSAHPWVLVVREHHAVRQPVKLGLRGDGRVEVLEGIAPGERVISAINGSVKNGQRVRLASPETGVR